MRPTTILTVTVALGGLLAASSPTMAVPSGYTFTTIVGRLGHGGYGINDSGQIVGNYLDSTGFHPFLDTRGVITNIDVPGEFPLATGINDRGQITGDFCDSAGCHGFLDTKGSFTTIHVPGASFTDPEGINERGQIVGVFADSTGLFSAFLATPINGLAMSAIAMSAVDPPADPVPEPSTWVMLLLGFTGLGFAGYRTTQKSVSIAA